MSTTGIADVIYRLDPDEAPLVAASARIGAEQVLDEWARSDPVIAAERRRHKRELKAWKRERNKLSEEISHLQIPFLVVVLMRDAEQERDAACAVIKVTDWLFENDAPAELMRDLLHTVKHWIPK